LKQNIKKNIKIGTMLLSSILLLGGCATSPTATNNRIATAAPEVSPTLQEQPYHGLKRVVAIGRFTDETKRANGLFRQAKTQNKMGQQASDMLAARLTSTGKFVMLERQDLSVLKQESTFDKKSLQGARYLIVGSVSEYGRESTSDVGVFSRTKRQRAYAAVNIRLIDVQTSEVIYAEEARGEAMAEKNRVLGIGGTAGYNSSLDDQALSAAISKLASNVVENLMDAPWEAYLVDKLSGHYLMTGGRTQGIKKGDNFVVLRKGKTIKNPQTGGVLTLPGEQVATVQVDGFIGKQNNTLSKLRLMSGQINGSLAEYVVQEG
jgi:curli biogenesis system outer membrane secretion channel CsgG